MNSKYNLNPEIIINECGNIKQLDKLIKIIIKNNYKKIIIETYPGVRLEVVKEKILKKINKKYKIFWSEDYAISGNEFRNKIKNELTNDRVFGKWTRREYKEFFINKIKTNDFMLCYGTGANYLIKNPDLVIYIDVPRWEIQLRYRNNEKVFFGGTLEKETITNFKRGYFIEWRMADKIKKNLISKMDYYIDGSTNDFNFITSKQLLSGLNQASKKPFRLVPYFDYGVWGGNWMEKKFALGQNKYSRWAWGFDGVPEENSVILRYGNKTIEMPSINIVFFETLNLLGKKVQKKFGADFPIRFDFLDTINGQNLSLQVHPDFQYIRSQFLAPYAQEESYYVLDVDEKLKPTCYLGVKNGINPKEFISALRRAQETNKMDVEKFVNRFPIKKHDHLLHPSGVVHSSGAGSMILEISATPYIFTFKLWDWARLGLNGKPRPINIEHGKNVIDYSFDTNKTKAELINNFKKIIETNDYYEEKTGLHEQQFIETRRIRIKSKNGAIIACHNSVNMLNLVEGKKVIVESLNRSFKPLIINYAETFIVPEFCKQYRIRNFDHNDDKTMILQAFVRTKNNINNMKK